MKCLLQIGLVVMVALSSPGLADDAADGPRTGYFRKSVTPLELLGEQGARAISGVFAPDQKLTWQLSVPKTYNPAKPAGAIVFVGPRSWGGGKREWVKVLEEKNIVWIGLVAAGDKKPLNERMLKAILAQAVLAQDYKISVDVANANWTNTIGSPELIAVWTDPEFDSKVNAAYYARVLEIPTPRWTAYEAKRFVIKMKKEIPMVNVERAITSPIWYTP